MEELNFRVHVLAAVVVITMGFCFKISVTEWLFVIGCSAMVMAMEMLNTAVEKICNLVSSEFHSLIKFIKDVSAGAVLICAIASALTGAIIFLPKIIHLLKST